MYNKKVLVTGGNGDIGECIVNIFQSKGFSVDFPSRKDLDLSEPNNILNQEFNYDIVVNCAGINEIKKLSETSLSDIDNLINTMNVNFFSPYNILKLCLSHMVKNKYGRIVNIGSIWQKFTKTGRSSYSISKSALHSLTKSIAVEYGLYNILCNTVSPGFIDTKLTRKNNTNDELKKIIESIPIGRMGTPKEVATVVYQLCVDNTFINGQNIIIDGGYSCLG